MSHFGKLVSALCAGMLLFTLTGCEKKGPAERTGEKIDKAVEKAGDELEKAGRELRKGLEETKEEIGKALEKEDLFGAF